MNPPLPPFGHPLPLGGGEGWGEGAARRFKGARHDQSSGRSFPARNEWGEGRAFAAPEWLRTRRRGEGHSIELASSPHPSSSSAGREKTSAVRVVVWPNSIRQGQKNLPWAKAGFRALICPCSATPRTSQLDENDKPGGTWFPCSSFWSSQRWSGRCVRGSKTKSATWHDRQARFRPGRKPRHPGRNPARNRSPDPPRRARLRPLPHLDWRCPRRPRWHRRVRWTQASSRARRKTFSKLSWRSPVWAFLRDRLMALRDGGPGRPWLPINRRKTCL